MKSDLVTCDLFKKRLVDLCVQGCLLGWPHKNQDRHILLKSMVLGLDKTVEYTEKEINEKLKSWLANIGASIDLDHVTLRRHLVELKYLERNDDGSCYRVCVSDPNQMMFETAIEDVDVYEVVRANKELIKQKKQNYLQSQKKERLSCKIL